MLEKIARERFISQKENIIIILNFACLFMLNIFRIFSKQIDEFLMPRSYIFPALTLIFNVIVLLILPKISAFIKNRKSAELAIASTDDAVDIQIERDSQMARFKDTLNHSSSRIIFFIGESGAGKSTLLDKFWKEHKADSYFRDRDYYESWIKDITKTSKQFVILDQFERALQNEKEICKLKTLEYLRTDTKIILGFRRDYLGEIYRFFDFDPDITIFYLECMEDDVNQIREKFVGLTGRSETALNNNALYADFQSQMEEGKLSMISYHLIASMIQDLGFDKVSQMYRKTGEFETLISKYLADELEKLEVPDVGLMILNLLSKDKKGEYINKIYDFENITFAKSKEITKTLEQLIKMGLIKEVKANKASQQIIQYEIAHDYLADKLLPISSEKLNAEISSNIDYYKAHKSVRRQNDGETVNTDLYDRYMTAGKVPVLVILLAMFAAIDFFDIFYGKQYSRLWLVLVPFISFFSVYYIYNYFYHFLRPLAKKFYCVIIFGALAVVFLFVFPDYWGISAGLEITCLGAFMLFMRKYANASEKKHFMKDVGVFCSIGGMVIWLGAVFAKMINEGKMEFYIQITFFLMYLVYIILSVFTHINKKHIVGLLGKCVR